MSDDFYVGYHAKAPGSLRGFLRGVAALLILVGAGTAALIAADQGPFRPSVFEFGVEREYTGWLTLDPVPALLTEVPGHHDGDHGEASSAICGTRYSSYLLAESGTKFGVADAVAPLAGQFVRLRGSLVYLDRETMIDVVPSSLTAIDGRAPDPLPAVQELGIQVLTGEVIDTKCHFGLMDPSTGKVHRGCAARCISSGVPPALHVEDEAGRVANLLLVGLGGEPVNAELKPFIGEPVRIEGRVTRHENLLVLYTDVDAIERL